MIDLLDDNADCAAIDRALREDEAVDTIPVEIVNAILDGATPLRAGDVDTGKAMMRDYINATIGHV